jgi:hypothetical protein
MNQRPTERQTFSGGFRGLPSWARGDLSLGWSLINSNLNTGKVSHRKNRDQVSVAVTQT